VKTKLKICGLTRAEDIATAAEAGASYVGFVFYDKSPRYISPEQVKEITSNFPENVKKVGVFVNASIEEIRETIKLCQLDVVQLHGEESGEFAQKLTGIEVWKALSLANDNDLIYAENYPADAILVDAMTAEKRGGTGQVCNWDLVAKLSAKRLVILAGGINLSNIAEAIDKVKPMIIDVNSGVETLPGIKDKNKIIELSSKVT
jgi:phosphoribosylanthranilate isomerase